MARDLPCIATGVATVYHYDGRRYLTKHAAFAKKAKHWMQRDHNACQGPDEDEWFDDCRCLWCRDQYERAGKLHKRLTRYLMRQGVGA
jgi:hypothetical protein